MRDLDGERLRAFLAKPAGWSVFQLVLIVVVLAGARLASALFGTEAFIPTLIVLALVSTVASYQLRRRFVRTSIWGDDEGYQADKRRPPGA